MRSSHSKFYLKRWHKIGLITILFTLDHSVVAWEQGGRWPLHWPGRGHGHRIPAGWHSSGARCQQERGHTRMSKSERRNCWNYTFNFHQAASTSGGGAVGQCHLGHRTPGTQGCLLLCNGQQDTSHLNWCIMEHNFQLQIISTPRVKNRALISKMNLKTFILAPKSNNDCKCIFHGRESNQNSISLQMSHAWDFSWQIVSIIKSSDVSPINTFWSCNLPWGTLSTNQ